MRVKDALDAVDGIVTNLVLACGGASVDHARSPPSWCSAARSRPAIATGVYDAVILKTLGATRRQLLTAYALEYLLHRRRHGGVRRRRGHAGRRRDRDASDGISLRLRRREAVGAALAAVAVTLVLGLVGTFTALGQQARGGAAES